MLLHSTFGLGNLEQSSENFDHSLETYEQECDIIRDVTIRRPTNIIFMHSYFTGDACKRAKKAGNLQ